MRMHPLALTYDELQRIKDRLNLLRSLYPEMKADLDRMTNEANSMIESIPEELRLTRHEWKKKYAESKD